MLTSCTDKKIMFYVKGFICNPETLYLGVYFRGSTTKHQNNSFIIFKNFYYHKPSSWTFDLVKIVDRNFLFTCDLEYGY